ncbi:origin recognition complex subunit 5 C-terminus-domain-containing protein [Gloeopeniophorella convolvens]|nr:origin recognition complex subunit 5 C-terminus-domain-containing protein [Gloeopeniophorella convolvens]
MSAYSDQLHLLTADTSAKFPGNDILISQLTTLITACPPTFTYIHDPFTSRITASLVSSLVSSIAAVCAVSDTGDNGISSLSIASANVNAVSCFSSRLFYDTTLNSLAKWHPRWDDGCENWSSGTNSSMRYNDSLDGFLHGLRALQSQLSDDVQSQGRGVGEGKGKLRSQGRAKDVKMVLVVDRAERLKVTLPELVVPLTRLAELSGVDIRTIFIAQSPWEDIKPPVGAAIDPFHLAVRPPSQEGVLQILLSRFPSDGDPSASPHAYHPALASLYAQYASVLYSTCAPFTRDPQELAYIAAAHWPGFVAPILNAQGGATDFQPIPEDVRLRLLRAFSPTFTTALEALLPRRTHAGAWCRAIDVDDTRGIDEKDAETAARSLPTLQKYILLAAFLASSNPARTDMRMFARHRDPRSKRRRGGGSRKAPQRNTSAPAKVPQHLIGPVAAPLDRLSAILAILLEEHDFETRAIGPEFSQPGEYTEAEISRVHISGAIAELAAARLLLRMSPPDRLDGTPMYKCSIPYDAALALGRELHVPMLDLIWETG